MYQSKAAVNHSKAAVKHAVKQAGPEQDSAPHLHGFSEAVVGSLKQTKKIKRARTTETREKTP
jgi:hypothetical protein